MVAPVWHFLYDIFYVRIFVLTIWYFVTYHLLKEMTPEMNAFVLLTQSFLNL